uniref:Ubiquitin-like domain-containing protein n=1 Tax=Oreochromis aureus TaxID=47969 RepID=A0AAZ1XVM9_OREAU
RVFCLDARSRDLATTWCFKGQWLICSSGLKRAPVSRAEERTEGGRKTNKAELADYSENCNTKSCRDVRGKAEGVKTENDHINLKVAGQDGSVVQFKIKRHTPLSKLMKAYCERQGLSIRQIRFRFDGQPINETDTPAQLEMEDEDTIDVFQQQTGGHC